MFAAEKAVVIGWDGAITKSILKYSKKGILPNITRLIENGVWAENCLVPHPTITPPNWTTIVTGAWPGTHGITCFHMHEPGWPLDYCPAAFQSPKCTAEYIWEAAERAHKRTIIVNYPSTWPPRGKGVIQIGGAGLHIDSWRIDRNGKPLFLWHKQNTTADEQLISTDEFPFADVIELREAKGWEGLPDGKYLEAPVKLGQRNTYDKVEPIEAFILVHSDSESKEYDRVSLALSKRPDEIMFTLGVGEWSKKQLLTFSTDRGEKRSAFKAKLLELSPDGENLRLYFSHFCQLDGWSYPDEVAEELEDIPGLPARVDGLSHRLGWMDSQTWLEMIREDTTWLGEASAHLLRKHDWTLFFVHFHAPDHFYHIALDNISPKVCKDEAVLEEYSRVEEQMYVDLDKMLGRIIETLDERVLLIVTSDHGVVPRVEEVFEGFSVGEILREAGLLAYKKNEKTGEQTIDWSVTRAVPQRSCYIYVNLKGRDPDGIVEPDEYEAVQDEIIKALYDFTDSKSGKKPIAFALKKSDARILGLYGDRIGDVVYGLRPEAPGIHGRQLTTGDYDVGSMRGLLTMAGPNIRKGHILERTVWLTDIVPTICYLMGLPIPKDAEGSIIYQALEKPDYLAEELKKLRRNYERLKSALQSERSLSHEYE